METKTKRRRKWPVVLLVIVLLIGAALAAAPYVAYKAAEEKMLSEDYDTVNQIWQDLKKDRETGRSRFNPLKERTREMALRRLETDFESYRNQLRDINGVIEERIEEQELSELRKK